MPEVVPSQIVEYIDLRFPRAREEADSGQAFQLGSNQAGVVGALLTLVAELPDNLLTVDGERYAEFQESVAELRSALALWERGEIRYRVDSVAGGRLNPTTVIRKILAACPDEAVRPSTTALAFIADSALSEALRLDISACNSALANAEWKAATVLAGSVVEALLLWALEDLKGHNRLGFDTAVSAAQTAAKLTSLPPKQLTKWDLVQYVAVAEEAALITADTASQCNIARGFRNIIHPGRSQRLNQSCNRGTAMSAIAAVEHVVVDLTP